jgi:hypothetical protein
MEGGTTFSSMYVKKMLRKFWLEMLKGRERLKLERAGKNFLNSCRKYVYRRV